MSELACPCCRVRAKGGYRGAGAGQQKQVLLASEIWEADIAVLRCPQCDGVWLLEGQLEQIKRTHAREHAAVDALAAAHARAYAAGQSASVTHEPVRCPSCDDELVATEHKRSHVTIDLCFACGGVWLTAEALSQIEVYAETLGG
jgi:Zn-finger nucleic acid-binding protein